MKKNLLSFFFVCTVLLQSSVTALASDTHNNLQNTLYCDKVTQTGNSIASIFNNQQIFNYFESIQDTTGFQPVSATRQTVYIIETLDYSGNVVESRLMTNQEVNEYNARVYAGQLTGNTWVGEDSEEHQGGKLSIYLVVYKDNNKNYYAYGTADWENGIYFGGENGPSEGYDFIALTWGGDGELKLASSSELSFSGRYQYNQGEIEASRANSDSYSGYCWQFNEKKGNYFADYIDCSVKLTKTYSTSRGRETNILLTYIHTYEDAQGSISFDAGTSGAAAGVSIANVDRQWQISVEVPGIDY